MPNTSYNNKTPILIGTNILNELMKDYKKNFGESYLQTAGLHTPWYLSFRCISIRERELKKNKDKLAIVRNAEISKVTIHPNQSIDIKGYTDKELNYHPTCAILQETEDSQLPEFIEISPSVTQFVYQKNGEIRVNLSNLSSNTVTISPRAILCELQPVTVDNTVFNNIENSNSYNIFENVHIETNLSREQNTQIRELLMKHKNIFSTSETDIGHCDKIKHRIDLIDPVPFKQRHRRIPPSMIDEVRQHFK